MKCYIDICEESLIAGVEVPLGVIGVLTWQSRKPRVDIDFYNPLTKMREEHKNLPGYNQVRLKVRPSFKKKLKQATLNEPWKEEQKND